MKEAFSKIRREYHYPYVYTCSVIVCGISLFLIFRYNWIWIYPISLLAIWLILKPIIQYIIYPLIKFFLFFVKDVMVLIKSIFVGHMEIRTKGYQSSTDKQPLLVYPDILLVDSEIVKMQVDNTGVSAKKPNVYQEQSDRLKYEIMFLDKYRLDIEKAWKYAKITFTPINSNKREVVYIRLKGTMRFRLKWMNKLFWIQTEGKATIFIACLALGISIATVILQIMKVI